MMTRSKCRVCAKKKAELFRVCRDCAKTHDSTTGDRLAGGGRRGR